MNQQAVDQAISFELKKLKEYNLDGCVFIESPQSNGIAIWPECGNFIIKKSNCKDVQVCICTTWDNKIELTIYKNTNSIPINLENGDWFVLQAVGEWYNSDVVKFVVDIRFYQHIIYKIKKWQKTLKLELCNLAK